MYGFFFLLWSTKRERQAPKTQKKIPIMHHKSNLWVVFQVFWSYTMSVPFEWKRADCYKYALLCSTKESRTGFEKTQRVSRWQNFNCWGELNALFKHSSTAKLILSCLLNRVGRWGGSRAFWTRLGLVIANRWQHFCCHPLGHFYLVWAVLMQTAKQTLVDVETDDSGHVWCASRISSPANSKSFHSSRAAKLNI